MKKYLPALCLCLALALSGCAATLERSHVSSAAHVDYAVEDEDDESVLRAESYQGLVNSMLYLVDGHRGGGVIRLYNSTGDVESDLAAAREAVLQDPMGAYAVGGLEWESTRILSYYEVELSIRYTRTAREMEAIPEVFGMAGVRQELNRLAAEREGTAVFMASYFSGDEELVDSLLLQGIYNVPELFCYPNGPETDLNYTVTLYPAQGTQRIVEVKVNWPENSQQAAQRVEKLEQAVAGLLEANPPLGEGYTLEELAAVLHAAHGGVEETGSRLPLEVLTGAPAREEGLLLAMEYLCRQCGIEVVAARGEEPRRNWLIVSTPEGHRHLLPESLHGEPGQPLALYTDRELTDMGYTWPASLYPVCAEPS